MDNEVKVVYSTGSAIKREVESFNQENGTNLFVSQDGQGVVEKVLKKHTTDLGVCGLYREYEKTVSKEHIYASFPTLADNRKTVLVYTEKYLELAKRIAKALEVDTVTICY